MKRFPPRLSELLGSIAPARFVYADHLTASAEKLFFKLLIATVGILVAFFPLRLVTVRNWQEVLAGVILPWGIAMIVWAFASYRRERSELKRKLGLAAEVDLLHARLNQIAAMVGAPLLKVDYELQHALEAREERLAHVTGLDEFREETHTGEGGHEFWADDAALGYHPPSEGEGDQIGRWEIQKG